MRDERVIEQKRKATSGGFLLLSWGILLALLYRQLVLEQTFADYGDIFVIWLAASAYTTLTATLGGVAPFDKEKWTLWRVPLVTALAATGGQLYYRSANSQNSLANAVTWPSTILFFAIAFLAAAGLYYLLFQLYKWWERRNLG